MGNHRARAWHVVPDMWTVPSWHMPARFSAGRPSLIVPGEVENVFVEGMHDTLPPVSEWRDDVGNHWKRYEMPVPTGDNELGPQSEVFRLTLQWESGDTESVEASLGGGVPRPGQDEEITEETDGPTPVSNLWELSGEHAMRMIAEHVDWTKRLVDRPFGDDDETRLRESWDRHASGLTAPSTKHALEEWKQNRENEPRLALIVEIARNHERLVKSICQRPRRVLARSRQVVGLGRVQEIDSGCLRWLARQPGRTVAERAGVRQRVMGIVRLESAETPENRVAKDFLKRAIVACGRYQREYRDFPNHPRVNLVVRFRRILIDLLLNSEIAGVRPLVGLAQPNYVLQHDSRYRVLWREYVKLVREQTAEDELWRWQHRVWSEVCAVATQAILATWSGTCPALQSELWLHGEQAVGRFISPWTMPGRWPLPENKGGIDFIDGRQVGSQPSWRYPVAELEELLAPLSPDFVLVRWQESVRPTAVVPVWTVFDFDVKGDCLSTRTSVLSAQLAALEQLPVSGLVFQPARSSQTTGRDLAQSARCLGARLSLPVQTGLDDLELLLMESLG